MNQMHLKSKSEGGTESFAQIFLKWIKDEKNKKKIRKIIGTVVLVAGLLGIGFFTGRKTVIIPDNDPDIIYIPGDTITVQYPEPEPVLIKVPADTAKIIEACIKSGRFTDLFPTQTKDSIVYVTKEDSAAVIRDWATERLYEQKVFDIDTVGTATIRAKTQYNRITWLGSTFVPVIKQTTLTNTIVKKYSPFVGVGITTMPEVLVNGGMYFEDKYGASVVYEYDWQTNRHAVGLMGSMKF